MHFSTATIASFLVMAAFTLAAVCLYPTVSPQNDVRALFRRLFLLVLTASDALLIHRTSYALYFGSPLHRMLTQPDALVVHRMAYVLCSNTLSFDTDQNRTLYLFTGLLRLTRSQGVVRALFRQPSSSDADHNRMIRLFTERGTCSVFMLP
ncbi:hypothetical protein PILCRDRAFT_15732 [Piloderma croceum F 1598]|uniref:Uncharacterized protein n=1 Tax=Piloderma croceum (strain F 1598) TaxID=765440 RepID=A0A0C3AGD3_PILCF|nr:hypothetical protein PILCRDRAFT_15732 [Piloderma croceum F 1598]